MRKVIDATTSRQPKVRAMLWTCRSRWASPSPAHRGSRWLRASRSTPPWYLSARNGGHDDHGVGPQTGLPALDVDEFLGTEIRAEAGLGHHIIGELERPPAWR